MKEQLKDKNDLLIMFDRYHKVLLNYIYFQINRRMDLAEDLTQDVFVKAWIKREQFDETKGNLKNWLFAIARNLIIDFWRDNKSINIEDSVFQDQKVDDDKEVEVLQHYLHIALEALSLEEREIIILRYIEGYDVASIAQIFDVSYTNAKVKVHRAMEKLKKIIQKDEKNR